MVRAKFRCYLKEQNADAVCVKMHPVYDGSPENREFFKATPGGDVTLYTVNLVAAEQIEQGKEYYVDFTPCTAEDD